MNSSRLFYFADPMCSWCYGFAPVMDTLRARYGRTLDIRLVMGGLRPGHLAQTMTPAIGRVIRHHWREVGKMTGQPFDEEFFAREGFVYDTEPAAKAVVTMEHLAPASAYDYYHTIQKAFYAQNADITSPDVLASAAAEFSVSAGEFITAWQSEAIRRETWDQFAFSAQMGIRGFPALVMETGNSFYLVCRGWQPLEKIEETLVLIEKTAAESTAASQGESCEIGDDC